MQAQFVINFSNPASFLFWHARRRRFRRSAVLGPIAINLIVLDLLTEAFQPPWVSPLFIFENHEVFGGSYRRNWQKNRRNWQKKTPKLSLLYRCVVASLSIPKGCFCESQFYYKCTSVNRKDLINTASGGGGNYRRVRTCPKPPIFLSLILACE